MNLQLLLVVPLADITAIVQPYVKVYDNNSSDNACACDPAPLISSLHILTLIHTGSP